VSPSGDMTVRDLGLDLDLILVLLYLLLETNEKEQTYVTMVT
jgi:hypothetical protein